MSNDEARMTFTEHLGELRLRIIRSAYAVAIGFIICYIFSNQIFAIVSRPLAPFRKTAVAEKPPQNGTEGAAPQTGSTAINPKTPIWVVQNPLESFWVKLKLAAYAGVILALPYLVYQICGFIFPGLTPTERKVAQFLIGGCAFFVVFGVLVAYFGVFPMILPYLMTWLPEGVQQQFRMNETVSLILMGLLGFAVSFQFPMVVLILVYLGLLSPAALKRYRRVAIIIMAVVAAVLTPPDPISMTMMLIPMIFLYEMSIWMSYLVIRRKRRADSTS